MWTPEGVLEALVPGRLPVPSQPGQYGSVAEVLQGNRPMAAGEEGTRALHLGTPGPPPRGPQVPQARCYRGKQEATGAVGILCRVQSEPRLFLHPRALRKLPKTVHPASRREWKLDLVPNEPSQHYTPCGFRESV